MVLDLTEMHAIGGGLGMLVLLQRWAEDIRFKLFNPSAPVRDKLNPTCAAQLATYTSNNCTHISPGYLEYIGSSVAR